MIPHLIVHNRKSDAKPFSTAVWLTTYYAKTDKSDHFVPLHTYPNKYYGTV